MTDDWMSRSHLDDERDEWRDARDQPLPEHWSHPLDCRCRSCVADEVASDMRRTQGES